MQLGRQLLQKSSLTKNPRAPLFAAGARTAEAACSYITFIYLLFDGYAVINLGPSEPGSIIQTDSIHGCSPEGVLIEH